MSEKSSPKKARKPTTKTTSTGGNASGSEKAYAATESMQALRDSLLPDILNAVVFDGWTDAAIENGTVSNGRDAHYGRLAFPLGIADVLRHVGVWADSQTLESLHHGASLQGLKIRDRIHTLVMTRYSVIAPYKSAFQDLAKHSPRYLPIFLRGFWLTADQLWQTAGDTATDWNYYSKRGLLAGVLATTAIVWLNDDSTDSANTTKALRGEIEGIVTVGKTLGNIAKFDAIRLVQHPLRAISGVGEKLREIIGSRS